MYLFWDPIIKPLFNLLQPSTIVFIGSDFAFETQNLLDYCVSHQAQLHIIDPVPKSDVAEWEQRYGQALVFHTAMSVDALPKIPAMNVVLIDGDQNWYTVYHELKLVEQQCQKHQQPFPLVFLHDIHWPYGRRDLYYDPDNVPEAHRQPYAKKGIRIGSTELVETGGLNWHLPNALREGGPRNGVLTGVEDFLKESSFNLKLLQIPGYYGLGVLHEESLAQENPAIREFLKIFELASPVDGLLRALEESRLQTLTQRCDRDWTINQMKIPSILKRMADQIQTALRISKPKPAISTIMSQARQSNASLVSQDVTVIIPVHNAFAEVKACIESVIKHTPRMYSILLIDDASTDPAIWPLLQSYAINHWQVKAVQNAKNLYWTATINEGLKHATGDVVLLNSDTVVTPGWVDKLVNVAYSRPNVATVTPLSNAAGAFSVPENNTVNILPPHLTVDEMAILVERLSPKLTPEVPIGNGYCLYITRHALDVVGQLNVEQFPYGYGAENDFCMRASAAGFVHLIEDSTFIFHHRSASFKESKHEKLEAANQKLKELHPSYKKRIRAWADNDPLNDFRNNLKVVIDSQKVLSDS